MFVDGTKFNDYDLGAFLVRCIITSELPVCRFFGQITKFDTINRINQIIVITTIPYAWLRKSKLTFRMKMEDSSTLIDSDNKVDKLIIQEGATSSMPSTSQEILGDKLHPAGRKRKLEHYLYEALDYNNLFGINDKDQHGEYKLPSIVGVHLTLGKFSCNSINKLGTFSLGNDIYITVQELEKLPSLAYSVKEYHIKGIYRRGFLEYYSFNKCYRSEDGDYVVQEEWDPSEFLK